MQSWIRSRTRRTNPSSNRGWLLRAAALLLLVPLPVSLSAGTGSAQPNALQGHPSPYLAMHGRDPVQWADWGDEPIARAQREGKLLFVSSGYFSCHWCHVMQRESYQDPEVAKLLNENFVPVKIDRELLPALDDYLISFVQETRGSAGWPLNVFLTPQGHPVFGLTYAPKAQFHTLLTELHKLWAEQRQDLADTARQAAAALRAGDAIRAVPVPHRSAAGWAEALQREAMSIADDLGGGFGQQNRFPMLPQVRTLLHSLAYRDEPSVREFLTLMLDQMASQGLRDHLRGGFFRYTVDPGWQTPHFEKMLYTNALMVPLYVEAARVLKRPAYLQVARDTLNFMLTDMRRPDGAFIASLSAVDDKDVEGGYYTWSEQDLADLSGDQRALLRQYWGLGADAPVVEGAQLPVCQSTLDKAAKALGVEPVAAQKQLDEIRALLQRRQAERVLPADDKVLTAWNALTLDALRVGAGLAEGARYAEAADHLYRYIRSKLWDGKSLRRDLAGSGSAALADYAYVAGAMARYGQWREHDEARQVAQAVSEAGWERFYSLPGWRGGAVQLIDLPPKSALSDGALPSASAVMIGAVLREPALRGNQHLTGLAAAALAQARARVGAGPFWFSSYLDSFFKKPEEGA